VKSVFVTGAGSGRAVREPSSFMPTAGESGGRSAISMGSPAASGKEVITTDFKISAEC
jgi:hypothetical protein